MIHDSHLISIFNRLLANELTAMSALYEYRNLECEVENLKTAPVLIGWLNSTLKFTNTSIPAGTSVYEQGDHFVIYYKTYDGHRTSKWLYKDSLMQMINFI